MKNTFTGTVLEKLMRLDVFFVTVLLLGVVLPATSMLSGEHHQDIQSNLYNDIRQSDARSSTSTVSPVSGWTTGGEEITITGSGFSNLAFVNTTDDGVNHQWHESTMDYSSEAGRYNSIVEDSSGDLHAVHINGGTYKIRYSTYDGTTWSSVNINDCGGASCWDVHMVIDDNDELHVAYTTESTWSETLVYMHFDGVDWTDEVVSSNANVGPIGIAVDSNNNPHISYAAEGQYCGDGLRIASYNGSSWAYEGIDVGDNRGCDSAMVIDEDDNIYIAYQNRDESKLKIATDKSSQWDIYDVDAGESLYDLWPGYMTSMVMDQQGQLHIAHFDDKEKDLRYSTGAPNSEWTTTLVDSTGHTGRDPSIALDFSGNVHIAYNSWVGWDLKYAIYDTATSAWDASTISTTGDVGKGSSILIDESGIMHVLFSDETADVLKYATKSTGLLQTKEITVQFGEYGSVTGTVVNDTTITVTTPLAGQTGDTINLTLWDKDDVSHLIGASFTFISPDDLDSDGVLNANDDCPNIAGNSTSDQTGCPDGDGDGTSDSNDAFPSDTSEWADADGDGTGDNADAFPNDANETLDTDGDGVGDNSDAFPNDASETLDSDGDGVGDNSDVFPFNALESLDSDGDGVGDNTDAFPNDANETTDTDGDGIGDNSDPNPTQHSGDDSDGDSIANADDAFPNDATQWLDIDGDGYGDNATGNSPDTFVDISTQWSDTDGDGYGDNWGNSTWNSTRLFIWPGQFVVGAFMPDHCPTEYGNSTVDGYFGCTDLDGDGIADIYDDDVTDLTNTSSDENSSSDSDGDGVLDASDLCPGTVENGYVGMDGCLFDQDGDGVDDLKDACPGTSSGVSVNANGCAVGDDEGSSFLDSLSSGDQGAVIQTVGFGAVILALFGFLQTNIVAALLPDSVRWLRVLRKDSKLNKEETRELEYLRSLVQTYHQDLGVMHDELYQLKSELTARYTNSEIKKITLEKLNTLILDLLSMQAHELNHIAHNDAYFGLGGSLNTKERTEYLSQDALMRFDESDDMHMANGAVPQIQNHHPSNEMRGQINETDGQEYLEYPSGSGFWFYRSQSTGEWTKWTQ
jgi:hypothetical protein